MRPLTVTKQEILYLTTKSSKVKVEALAFKNKNYACHSNRKCFFNQTKTFKDVHKINLPLFKH